MTTKTTDRSYYDECLPVWDHPTGFDGDSNFIGIKPKGYVIYSRNRESSILEQVNFDCILSELGFESEFVEVVRHKHWACGWIEYIMVSREAPEKLLDTCVEITRALDDYPVLDTDAYREAQHNAVYEYWNECSLRERIDHCNDGGDSIFAARRSDQIPDGAFNLLLEDERFD